MAYNSPEEYIFLSTQTASTSASLSFTSLISSKYPVYYIKIRALLPDTDAVNLLLTFSTDNGSTYLASNYGWGLASNRSNGLTAVVSGNLTATSIEIADVVSSTSTRPFNSEIYIYNLNTTSLVQLKGKSARYDSNGVLNEEYFTGINTGTTAVTAIKFAMSSGNILSGTITLYGMTL